MTGESMILATSLRGPVAQWSDIASMVQPQPWMQQALCAQTDPEAFFPDKGGSTREAKKMCASCTVVEQCLEYAMARDERFGIWGGKSERERRAMKRPKLSANQERVLREMSELKATNREIASVLHLSALTIGQYRRALRLPVAPQGRPITNGASA